MNERKDHEASLTPWSESFAEDVSRKDYPEAPPSSPPPQIQSMMARDTSTCPCLTTEGIRSSIIITRWYNGKVEDG